MHALLLALTAALPANLAADLKTAADEQFYLVAPATGVQIYECGEKDGKWGWQFKSPEAKLFDESRSNQIGKHYGGPTWEANDGSKAKGTVVARQDGAAGSIPWLLATATTEGSGRFTGVTHVQRLNTVGGVAPTSTCDKSIAGKVERVDYTADYFFYRKK